MIEAGEGGFAGLLYVILLLSWDIQLNPGPGHAQNMPSDAVQDTSKTYTFCSVSLA